MTPYQKRLTPITDRMAGDMRIRNLAQATIDAYTYHVGRFADFIQRPIGDATAEDVRNFQLYLVEEKKVGWSTFNQAVCGLRFLYTTTLPKPWPITSIPFGKRPRRLPTVLAVEEVDALLQCTKNLKQRTFLMTPGTDRRVGRLWSEAVRSRRLADRPRRQRPDAIERRRWQRQQAAVGSTVTETLDRVADLLETVSTNALPVPGQDIGSALRGDLDPEGDQGIRQTGGHQEECHSAHIAAFLRDRDPPSVCARWKRAWIS